MAKVPKKSDAEREAALEMKRAERSARIKTRIQWFDKQLVSGVQKTMEARVSFCAQSLRDQIVVNIGKPVRKNKRTRRNTITGKRQTRTVVDETSRSKPGEFPRVDTSRLMKDIFWQKASADGLRAIVGTTLDYGLLLETQMNRSFILRTFNEMKNSLANILGKDIAVRFRSAS